MTEWIFILAFLVPALILTVGVLRFAKRLQQMTRQFQDPEALARHLQAAIEERGIDGLPEGLRPGIHVESNLDEALGRRPRVPGVAPGSMGKGEAPTWPVSSDGAPSPRTPSLPAPIDAGSRRSRIVWLAVGLVLGGLATALLLR